jgi:hypothetical protein
MTPWLVSLATGSVMAPVWLTVADSERPSLVGRPAKTSWLARVPEGRPARLELELSPPTPLRLIVLTGLMPGDAPDLACTVTDASGSVARRTWPGARTEPRLTIPLGSLGAVRYVAIAASRSVPGPPVAIERIVGWTASEPSRDVSWPELARPVPRLHGLVIEPGPLPSRGVVVGEALPATGTVTVDGRACRVVASTSTQLLCAWSGPVPNLPVQLVLSGGTTPLTRRVRAVRRPVVWPPAREEGAQP